MNVGIITNFPKNTGSGRYAYELYDRLKHQAGIKLLSCGENPDNAIHGIKFPFYRMTLNSFFIYPRRVPKDYDVVHFTNQFLMNGARFSKNSVVTVLDTIMLEFPGYPFLTRALQKNALKSLDFAKQIIAISNHTKEDLIKRGIGGDKIKTIYLGYSEQVFRKQDKAKCREMLGLPLDKKIVLHVGSEEPRKNVDKLLLAFKEATKNNDDVLLVRVGEKSKKILELAEHLGISDKMIHFGRLPDDTKLAQVYNSADVFAFPSSYEGFGIPPLEAMACGVPVISSDKTSLKEVVRDAAIIIEPENVLELAEKITEVLSKKALQDKLSAKGLSNAKKFTWDRCAKETLNVYESII